jgi:release factor glutamine methyltransferase
MAGNINASGTPFTIAEWQNFAIQQIQKQSDTPQLDVQVLLAHFLGKSRAWILTYPEVILSPDIQATLDAAIEKYIHGLPLPYILGEWEFFNLSFRVSPNVLIPRPESELLVETALNWLNADPTRTNMVDIGTGSGCIAIALAVNHPKIQVTATDVSAAALKIAKANATRYSIAQRIQFIHSDLFSAFPPPNSQFDLITANLPYIPTKTLLDLAVYKREPTQALDGGPDGLDLIRKLLQEAPLYLIPGGLVLLEIEDTQGNAAITLAQAFFPESEINCLPDLAGKDRLVKIETPL